MSPRFLHDERGAALVEYGILLGVIALLAMVGVWELGKYVSLIFDALWAELSFYGIGS